MSKVERLNGSRTEGMRETASWSVWEGRSVGHSLKLEASVKTLQGTSKSASVINCLEWLVEVNGHMDAAKAR